MADDELVTDPELIRIYQEEAEQLRQAQDLTEHLPAYAGKTGPSGRTTGFFEAEQRRLHVIQLVAGGSTVKDACREVGVQYETYLSWRQRFPEFGPKVDEVRQLAQAGKLAVWDGTSASFAAQFFGHKRAWFQILACREMDRMPRGNILMSLWPPEHGKTTTFEDYASEKLALDPTYRFLVASESRSIAQKILGRVMGRMEPMGSAPAYVERYGPFAPQTGQRGRKRQPWSDIRFSVYKSGAFDERDYSMLAVGAGSKNIVSTRTDHAHIDDIQSITTLNKTPTLIPWFRQDLLSRPGETGITTIAGTRVGDQDFYEELLEDDELDQSILKVLRFPAIVVDPNTNEVRPLWPEQWTLEKLDRQRRKVGQEAWDRNYMQSPGRSTKGRGTFNKDAVEPCLDSTISLLHRAPYGTVLYTGLDPSIGGKNCVVIVQPTSDGRLIVRRIQEQVNLKNNSQVINEVETSLAFASADGAHCTDVVIEAMAFQKGLMHDEDLEIVRKRRGFSVRDHLTGWNKYDADIGLPSMAKDFIDRKIVLPWAEDAYTREMIGELKRQLYNWKPGKRGNVLRQDMVMALWFAWIIWRERYKRPTETKDRNQFRTNALPYAPTRSGLLVPAGIRR